MIYPSNPENNMKRDGIEMVTDYVDTEKLHQKESLESQFLFSQTKKKGGEVFKIVFWFAFFFIFP